MEIRQLHYFVTVAEELGFARAAERLHIVQPAVSQQVRRVERELGVRLFDRTSRRVRLTGAGERLLPEARAVLAATEKTRQVAEQIVAGNQGALRLGTSQGLGERLARVLHELRRAAPDLDVQLVAAPAAERIAAVRSGELDAAFLRAMTTAPGLELVPMWDDALTAVLPAAHPLAARAALDLADLAGVPLRLAPRADNPPFHDLIQRAYESADQTPVFGPAFTNTQDTLAEIGTRPPSWTVLYTSSAEQIAHRRVALRPLIGVAAQTSLAVATGERSAVLSRLLDACAAAARPDTE